MEQAKEQRTAEVALIGNALLFTGEQEDPGLLSVLSDSGFELFRVDSKPPHCIEGIYHLRTWRSGGKITDFAIDRGVKATSESVMMRRIFSQYRPKRTRPGLCGVGVVEEYADWPARFEVDLSEDPETRIHPVAEMTREVAVAEKKGM